VARQREGILVLAADRVADGDALRVGAHVAILDGAPQAVVDRRVDELPIAEPESEPRAGEQERGLVHRFHAARHDDVGVAGPDLGCGEHDRLEARAADAVDRRRARPVREAATERSLTGGGLADARLQHLAHQDLVDRGSLGQAGALDGRANGDTPELDRRHARKGASELADWRSRCARQEDLAVPPLDVLCHGTNLHRVCP
jgi:hypothetical protein